MQGACTGVVGWLDPLGGWTPGPTVLGWLDQGSNCPAGRMDPPWMDGPTADSANADLQYTLCGDGAITPPDRWTPSLLYRNSYQIKHLRDQVR